MFAVATHRDRDGAKKHPHKSFVYESDEEGGSDSDDIFTNALNLEKRRFLEMDQKERETMLMLSMQRLYKCSRRMERRQRVKEQRDSVSLKDMVTKFRLIDEDGSGGITTNEFEKAMVDMGVHMKPNAYRLLFKQLDLDGDGQISIEEFKAMCKQQLRHFPMSSMDELLQQAVKEKMKEAKLMVYRMGNPLTPAERRAEGFGTTRAPNNVTLWDTHLHAPYSQWPKNCCARNRLRLHLTLEDESYSCLSMVIFAVIMLLIMLSTIAYVLESCQFSEDYPEVFWMAEVTISVIFTVEVVLRLAVCRNLCIPWQKDEGYYTWYFLDIMNTIDVVAVVPFYVDVLLKALEPGSEGPAFLRVIRILRLLRIVRLRRFEFIRINMQTIHKALVDTLHDSCAIITAILSMTILLCSVFVYLFEMGTPTKGCELFAQSDCETATRKNETGDILSSCKWNQALYEADPSCKPVRFRSDGNVSPFHSIPEAMWWCVSTITTVGYGEIYPIEIAGKVLGVFTMLAGVVVVAFFVVIIAGNFDRAHQHALQTKKALKTRKTAEMANTQRHKSYESWAKDAEESMRGTGDDDDLSDSRDMMEVRKNIPRPFDEIWHGEGGHAGERENPRKPSHKHFRNMTAPVRLRVLERDDVGSGWNSKGGSGHWPQLVSKVAQHGDDDAAPIDGESTAKPRVRPQISHQRSALTHGNAAGLNLELDISPGLHPGEEDTSEPGRINSPRKSKSLQHPPPVPPARRDSAIQSDYSLDGPKSTRLMPVISEEIPPKPPDAFVAQRGNMQPDEMPVSPGLPTQTSHKWNVDGKTLSEHTKDVTPRVARILNALESVGEMYSMQRPVEEIYIVLKSLLEPDDQNPSKSGKARRREDERQRREAVSARGRRARRGQSNKSDRKGHKKVRSKLPFYPEMHLIDPNTGKLELYNLRTSQLPDYVRKLGSKTTRDKTRQELASLARTRQERANSRSASENDEPEHGHAARHHVHSKEGHRSADPAPEREDSRELTAIVNEGKAGVSRPGSRPKPRPRPAPGEVQGIATGRESVRLPDMRANGNFSPSSEPASLPSVGGAEPQ